jgi:hypothetical protein
VDVSLGALRQRLLNFRSWDSSGKTLDDRIREALNTSLDRLAGDVPQALIPDEAHIALLPDVKGTTEKATVLGTTDLRVLQFFDTSGTALGSSSVTSWLPTIDGTWDGLMHIEFTDSTSVVHRRQCLEFFKITDSGVTKYYATIDRPWTDPSGTISTSNRMDFRLHQPEFFLRDDVMQVREPAKVFDSTRQQVWAVDTAGAYRQDMIDHRGTSTGRPYRLWRGRHFQLPAPTEAPEVKELVVPTEHLMGVFDDDADQAASESQLWGHSTPETAYSTGEWGVCYTYVMGRRDKEWQQSPLVQPDATEVVNDSTHKLNWAFESYGGTLSTGVNARSGINDPLWESAPSPITTIKNTVDTLARQTKYPDEGGGTPLPPGSVSRRALVLAATNIGAQLGFAGKVPDHPDKFTTPSLRDGRSGYRIRYYIAQLDSNNDSPSYDTETTPRYYFLCEVEPTFDQLTLSPFGTTDHRRSTQKTGARIVWNGDQLYDYHRPLRHSTGYYAYKVYPHQDARYELDFRVLRLPRKYIDNQDTAPIQRDAVPALIELSLYYLCLIDGVDQQGAQLHLDRYTELARRYRERYANPGRVVEPVPMFGYSARHRYGTFGSTSE